MTRRRRLRAPRAPGAVSGAGAVAVALTATLVLAGCGGGGVEPQAWTGDVCSSAQQYQNQVQDAASKFRPDPTDPAKTKKSFVTLLSSIEGALKGLQADIEAAGVPDTENGEASQQQILDGLRASEKTFAKAQEDVKAASAANMDELSKVFGQVSRDVSASLQEFGRLQAKLRSPELKKAFEQLPACKKLRS